MANLTGKTTTVSLIDLAEHLEAEGLEIARPIYYRWIDGVHTPILTVQKKRLAGQGETLTVHAAPRSCNVNA